MAVTTDELKILIKNKKAYHDYQILQTVEAGISLVGTEVKSVKEGKINIKDGYAFISKGEMFLKNVHISQYPFGNMYNHDPIRVRKLLLHKDEIRKLHAKIKERGLTLIPLKVYSKRGIIKLELGLCKGKQLYNKKEEIREKDQKRELKRDYKISRLSGKLK